MNKLQVCTICGTLQLLFFLGYCYLAALLTARGSEWISAGSGLIGNYLRTVLFGAASFLGVCTLPILAKWMLIGRWKPQEIRIWSLAYVRFWIVKTLVRSNPLVRFGGSPLYVLYLRALGAKVGPLKSFLDKSSTGGRFQIMLQGNSARRVRQCDVCLEAPWLPF